MYSLEDHYKDLECRRLRVRLKDGTTREGEFWGIYTGVDTDSGVAELELDPGLEHTYYAVREDEIEDIEILSEKHGEWM